MRTSPLIGRKAWFGPRRVGWGLGPASTEGWILTLIFSLLATLSKRWGRAPGWVRPLLIVGFLLVMILKGSAPGGARARADFQAAHESRSGS